MCSILFFTKIIKEYFFQVQCSCPPDRQGLLCETPVDPALTSIFLQHSAPGYQADQGDKDKQIHDDDADTVGDIIAFTGQDLFEYNSTGSGAAERMDIGVRFQTLKPSGIKAISFHCASH